MKTQGDVWSAWCSLCRRFVAEDVAQVSVRVAWEAHWSAEHQVSELVR